MNKEKQISLFVWSRLPRQNLRRKGGNHRDALNTLFHFKQIEYKFNTKLYITRTNKSHCKALVCPVPIILLREASFIEMKKDESLNQ